MKSELQPSLDLLKGCDKLVLRDFLPRPVFKIDDEPLLFIWLGNDVEVDMVDLLMSDTSIVLDAHSMSIQWTPRVSRTLTCKRL